MTPLEQLQQEWAHEYETTVKFIQRFPHDKNEYAPHEKSMKMMPLATHIVEIFAWPETILNKEELDFAKGDYQPTILTTPAELLTKLENDFEKGKKAMKQYQDNIDTQRWTMRMGEQVLQDWTKREALRHSINQIIHHRAQLGVYYRLNNIVVPGSFGPSADEQSF
ncbi:MAG: damage-inducible protein DinB [Bacteroidetes bacterium]|nr:damage-inducible protein DinB [Bacteroidota bacterium]